MFILAVRKPQGITRFVLYLHRELIVKCMIYSRAFLVFHSVYCTVHSSFNRKNIFQTAVFTPDTFPWCTVLNEHWVKFRLYSSAFIASDFVYCTHFVFEIRNVWKRHDSFQSLLHFVFCTHLCFAVTERFQKFFSCIIMTLIWLKIRIKHCRNFEICTTTV